MNASNRTVKSFALGYGLTNTVIDTASIATAKVSDAATATKDTTTGFFAGVKFAIAERRGEATPKAAPDEEAKLRAARDLYARAHAQPLENPMIVVAPNGN